MKILLSTARMARGDHAHGQDLEIWVVTDDGVKTKLNNVQSLVLRAPSRRDRITVELVLAGVEVEQVVADLKAADTFDELAVRKG